MSCISSVLFPVAFQSVIILYVWKLPHLYILINHLVLQFSVVPVQKNAETYTRDSFSSAIFLTCSVENQFPIPYCTFPPPFVPGETTCSSI